MTRAVEDVLEEIGAGERPRLLVLNKADLLDELGARARRQRPPRRAARLRRRPARASTRCASASRRSSCSSREPVELLLPYAEGARLAELHELAGELEREDTPEGVRVRALLPPASAARFARFAAPPPAAP